MPIPRVRADALAPGDVVVLVFKKLAEVWAPALIPDPLYGGRFTVVRAAPDTPKTGKTTRKAVRVVLRQLDGDDAVELVVDPEELFVANPTARPAP